MCRSHTHLAATGGEQLPPAQPVMAQLPAAQRKIAGVVGKIVGDARKRGIAPMVAGWFENAARSLRDTPK